MTKKPAAPTKTKTDAAPDIPTSPHSKIELLPRFALRGLLVIAAVALGDFLFFGHSLGISLFFYMAALAAALLIATRPLTKSVALATVALSLALLPLVEDVNLLSVGIAILALVSFAAFIAAGEARFGELMRSVIALLAVGPFQFMPDLARARRTGRIGIKPSELTGWLLPIGCGVVFLVLFGAANPLIDEWIAAFNPLRLLEYIDFFRVIFWLFLLALAWPIILPRMRKRWRFFDTGFSAGKFYSTGLVYVLFTPAAILRSLVLFNLLFAVQTGMDIAYLWGGVALPDGMTYANYAHRGAYPLIVTALLAAAFVLIAVPAREAPRPLIHTFVLAFILQNVMLVISSMLRLDLYIEAYSLTLLRVAAFIWMGLVAFGLALILVRIVLQRSNAWLVGANLAALTALLYTCAFADLSGFVANYNVDRRIEHGMDVDRSYLWSLGPSALPAIYRLRQYYQEDRTIFNAQPEVLTAWIGHLTHDLRNQMEDWRGWSFRGQRLVNYLDAPPSAKPQPAEEDEENGAPA